MLPEHPEDALKKGVGADIELIVGTNTEEMNLFRAERRAAQDRQIPCQLCGRQGRAEGARFLKACGINDKSKRPGDAFTEALTDLVFRWPARKFAAASRAHVRL